MRKRKRAQHSQCPPYRLRLNSSMLSSPPISLNLSHIPSSPQAPSHIIIIKISYIWCTLVFIISLPTGSSSLSFCSFVLACMYFLFVDHIYNKFCALYKIRGQLMKTYITKLIGWQILPMPLSFEAGNRQV